MPNAVEAIPRFGKAYTRERTNRIPNSMKIPIPHKHVLKTGNHRLALNRREERLAFPGTPTARTNRSNAKPAKSHASVEKMVSTTSARYGGFGDPLQTVLAIHKWIARIAACTAITAVAVAVSANIS
jgi:hypothetical protein